MLAADADLSDCWTIRIWVFPGPSIDSAAFRAIAETLVTEYNSAAITDLSRNGASLAFDLTALLRPHRKTPNAHLNVLFIFDYVPNKVITEWRKLFTHKRCFAAICIDSRSSKITDSEACLLAEKIREAVNSQCPEIQLFQMLYVREEGRAKAPICLSESHVWEIPSSSKNIRVPIHDFFRRIVQYILNLAQSLATGEQDRLTASPRAAPRAPPKNTAGRTKKKVGDLYLLTGQALAALSVYHEATEMCKSANDSIWHAACVECEAAAVRLYSIITLDLQNSGSRSSSPRVSNASTDTTIANPTTTTDGSSALPAEIEQLIRETPRRWPIPFSIGLLSGSNASDPVGPSLLSDSSPSRSGVSPSVTSTCDVITYSNRIEQRLGKLSQTGRVILLDVTAGKLKEAVQLFQKLNTGSVLFSIETFLRSARLFAASGEKLSCLETFSKLAEEEKHLNIPDLHNLLIGCSSIALSVGARRHFAFFLLRVALSKLENHLDSAAVAISTIVAPWYFLSSFQILDWITHQEDITIPSYVTHPSRDEICQLLRLAIERYGILEPSIPGHLLKNTKFQSAQPVRGLRQYSDSSLRFFQRHETKLRLHHPHTTSYSTILLWPALQVFVLETMCRAFERIEDFKSAIFCSYVLLTALHSALDAHTQSLILQFMSSKSKTMKTRVSFPPSLTIIPMHMSPVIGYKPILKRRGGHTFQNNKIFQEPLYIAGLTRGLCPAVPALEQLKIDVLLGNGWVENPGKDVYSCVHRRTNYSNDDTPKTDSSIIKKDSQIFDNLRRDMSSSGVFLFSPWKSKHIGNTGVKMNLFNTIGRIDTTAENMFNDTKVQQSALWVINEMQRIRILMNNPLKVELILDHIQIIALDGIIETQPGTLRLSHGPDVQSVLLEVHIIPRSVGLIYLVGISFTLAKSNCTQLLLFNTPEFQQYLKQSSPHIQQTSSFNDIIQTSISSFDLEHDVIRASSIIKVDVVEKVSHLTPSLQFAIDHHNNSPPISTIPSKNHTIHKQTVTSLLSSDIPSYITVNPLTFWKSDDSFEFYLYLSNLSHINTTDIIQIILFQNVHYSYKDWVNQITNIIDPEALFVEFENSHIEEPHTEESDSLPYVEFILEKKFICISPSNHSLGSCRLIKPDYYSSHYISLTSLGLAPGENCRIPLIAKGYTPVQQVVACVRYGVQSDADCFRYLLYPIRIPQQSLPPVCIIPKSLTLSPIELFDTLPLAAVAFESQEFSLNVRSIFKTFINQENHVYNPTRPNFDNSHVFLIIHIMNTSDMYIECTGTPGLNIPQITCSPQSTSRWFIPIPRLYIGNMKLAKDTSSVLNTSSDFITNLPPEIQHILSQLLWRHKKILYPMRFQSQLTDSNLMTSVSLTSALKTGELSIPSQYLFYLELPMLFMRWIINGNDTHMSQSCITTTVGSSITLDIFVQLTETSEYNNEDVTVFVIPIEPLRRKSAALVDARDTSRLQSTSNISDHIFSGMIWSPSLEKMLHATKEKEEVFQLTIMTLYPDTHSLFIGCVCNRTQQIFWHSKQIQIVCSE